MEFSKNSWHYKLTTYLYGSHPYRVSLCEYFWTVVLATVFCWIWVPHRWVGEAIPRRQHSNWNMLGHVLAFGLNLFSVVFIGALVSDYNKVIDTMFLATAIIGIIAALGGVIMGFYFLCRYIYHKVDERPVSDYKPNIVVEFVKAKKNKYCPIIDFVDDEKND